MAQQTKQKPNAADRALMLEGERLTDEIWLALKLGDRTRVDSLFLSKAENIRKRRELSRNERTPLGVFA